MKMTHKIGVVTALLVTIAFSSKAQTTPSSDKQEFRLSIGPDAGVPLGNFSNAYNWNFGGSIQADIPIIRNLYVTVNAGYDNFFVKNGQLPDQIPSRNMEVIPVKAGLKYFPFGKLFYVQGEAGASFLADKSDVGADKAAAFVYAPQIGVLLPNASKNYIDIGFRFEGTSSFYNGGSSNNFLGLRVAYSFAL